MSGKKWWVIVLVVAVAALITFRSVALTPQWRSVESSEGQFRVSLPGEPSKSDDPATDALDGSKFVSHRLSSALRKRTIFAVTWWENPAQSEKTPDELFAHFRECDLKVFHGTIARDERLDIQGFPANDLVVFGAKGGFAAENRLIRVGSRIYSLWVIGPSDNVDKADARKFFDSFLLIKQRG